MISRWLRRLLYWWYFDRRDRRDSRLSTEWCRQRLQNEDVEQEPWGVG